MATTAEPNAGHDDTNGDDRGAGTDRHDHAVDHHHDRGVGARLRHAAREFFAPHSHSTTDQIDDALEADERGMRAVKVSLAALGLTALIQGAIVVVSGSVALLGDTVHNVTDALTAIPLWLAFSLGRRAPTRRYTYGYGRAEDLAGIAIVLVIAFSAVLVAYESLGRLLDPRPVTNLWVVAAAGVVGFIGNELVAGYRIRAGRKIGSAALVADGLHARTDGLTSLAVVVGVIGVALGFERADPVVGLLITVAILLILRGAAVDVYRRLMDAVDPELVDQIERSVAGVDGVSDVGAVRVRWIGHELLAEVRVVCEANCSLAQAHDLAEHVEHDLLHDVPRLASVVVHVDPPDDGTGDTHRITAHHREREQGRDTSR